MRVVINAQLDPSDSGGIAQVVLGLVHGLGQLEERDEYVFVCSPLSARWLKPFLGAGSRIEINDRAALSPVHGARVSDGFWESFDPDVLHFPYQAYTCTDVPTVFNPHDLQHVHLPDCFTRQERLRRDALYAQACGHAAAVATASESVRQDLLNHYNLPPQRVHVIPWGAPTAAYDRVRKEDVAHVLAKYHLTQPFGLYPAQTWPHKNHARLLDALHLARESHGVRLSMVCPGKRTEHYAHLRRRVATLGLTGHVHFLGRVRESELMALYAAADFVIVPTLFEAMSFPVLEAFAERLPVACSNVTSLSQQVGDAALLFDPNSTEQIAEAMVALHGDRRLRATLVERSVERMAQFTWKRTALGYQVLYRAVARDRGCASIGAADGPTFVCGAVETHRAAEEGGPR